MHGACRIHPVTVLNPARWLPPGLGGARGHRSPMSLGPFTLAEWGERQRADLGRGLSGAVGPFPVSVPWGQSSSRSWRICAGCSTSRHCAALLLVGRAGRP